MPRFAPLPSPAPAFRWFRATVAGSLIILAGCIPRETGEVRLRAAFWAPPGIQEEIARRFEAAHPGVKVELLITGGRYAEKLQSMIVAGNEPDVLMVHDTFYHDWAARDVLLDLTDFVADMHREDPFLPVPLEAFLWQGRHYAVPTESNAMVTLGNLDAAAYADIPYPWPQFTWAELEQWGPRLSRFGGNREAPTEYLCALPQEWFFFSAYGAQAFDDPHHPRAVVVESPVTLAALEYWRRMHQRGWAVPRSTVLDQGESEMFRDGRIAFMFWGRGVSHIVALNRALRWDIAPLPAGPAGQQVPHLSVALGISRRSDRVELAKQFLRFSVSDRAVEVPVRAGVSVPVRRRQAYGDDFLGLQPPVSTRRFVEPLEAGGAMAVAYCPGRLEVDDIIRRRFEQALSEPELPAEQIMAGLGVELRAWLRRMQDKGLL